MHIREAALVQQESVPSVLETAATGEIAAIYSDIRKTLRTSVVNLIWRNLATMPARWGAAAAHAEAVRRGLALPSVPPFSENALAAAQVDKAAVAEIRVILDSYYHTNALALVVLSALLAHYDPGVASPVQPHESPPQQPGTELPALPPMAALPPPVQRLIEELNGFGEDTERSLIASMYRHLAYWPPYLAMVRTILVPLQADGTLNALTVSARALGRAHGHVLSRQLAPGKPPESKDLALAACRQFVEHPIARMTGICAIIRGATPEQA
jgi:hypothetical protein